MSNELTERGAQHLSAAMAAPGAGLTALRLNGNELGAEGGRHIAWLIGQPHCVLTELDLGQTGQTTGSLNSILTALRNNTSLRDLVLDRPLLPDGCDEAAAQLSVVLRVNSTLRRLSVQKFSLTDDQMRLLCDGLAGNSSLTELDLTANRLHRDAVRHLVAALAENGALRVIRLCHNRIQTEGALWLARGLTEHGARDELHIRANDVGSDGLLALLTELKYDRLKRLHFWGNPWCARVPAEVDVLWKTGVVDPSRVDVRPYVVDYMPHLAELSQTDRLEYYNVTRYGDRTNDKVRIGYAV
ncbi:Leucine-rich repeat-containing protein 34 [Amphibalanus amphitrite]|uniref:Leucine-rich repeat-containing protein 34 n=1 Tax=Amphibalanus amphitrite TaxID=1232801 RepID=A0A6A4VMA9_AMPAM|nr:Leucine-rich repeat-containing protein 34 [Amphibalanus amphitrite]